MKHSYSRGTSGWMITR